MNLLCNRRNPLLPSPEAPGGSRGTLWLSTNPLARRGSWDVIPGNYGIRRNGLRGGSGWNFLVERVLRLWRCPGSFECPSLEVPVVALSARVGSGHGLDRMIPEVFSSRDNPRILCWCRFLVLSLHAGILALCSNSGCANTGESLKSRTFCFSICIGKPGKMEAGS